MFPRNEGTADRIARAVAGSGLIALSVGLSVASRRRLGLGAALLGSTLLFTAVSGSCQLYRPFGINTTT
jgi:hypothetical protein